MKNLSGYLKRYAMESVLAPLFKLLEVILDLMVPLVVARMINIGVAGNDRTYMVQCFGILIGMALLGLAASITAQFFAAKASTGFAADLRQAVFDHIQGFSFTELDTLGADTMITRLTDDINQVQTGVNMGLRLLLRSPFVVFGAMVMAFTIDVKCAWIFAGAIPVLFLVVFAIMLVSIPLFKKAQSALDRVTCLTRENLTGVRVIRAFCREGQSVREFDESSRYLTKLNEFVGRISALLNPLTYVLINIAAVILIDWAAIEVSIGGIAQGDVVALNNYMLQITVELIKLASLIITLNKSVACAGRVSSVLAQPASMAYPAENVKPAEDAQDAVCFDHVGFTYKNAGAPSLTNVSFRAKKGQTIGIIGGTGSGKSTLVSLIPRFYDPQQGTVALDGEDARNYTRETLCEKVGVVQQRAVLFQGTIRDNLRWGNENADDAALWEALEAAQAKEVVEAKPGQLDFQLEQGGRNLSGGQKQRLSIARALVKKPEILILDDSSSALDFATDAALRRSIRNLGYDVTTFLVSQRIACIRQADQILVLDNGSLAGVGTHEQLLESCPLYQEIFDSQFPGERKNAKEGNAQ
ncbi:ABC transporter ATP-binding protein/permease [Pseudoflavonifractor sp. MSJ-30]|uniref:ABC transporter ATP-binding protein n=1 Tax=Pseudoflavonifractor sp. MSJ-30 TaxID=2841525 RepID=UPI001C11DF7D|nr:ABC transporter ATP-binding protein [Pseudoflavonifractor sp. MSJ-30]MBU5452675.1 ABC transporter ATP-binding protein/permease [Pseudoflavonifractor sp. MSJ-30]